MKPSLNHAPKPAEATYGFHCEITDKDLSTAVVRVTEALKTSSPEVLKVAHEVYERLQRVKALLGVPVPTGA